MPRATKTFEDVTAVLRDIEGRLSNLERNSIDFHGRRITNAGSAINPGDYITKGQVDNAIAEVPALSQNFTGDLKVNQGDILLREGRLTFNPGQCTISIGTGSPEGSVYAQQGSLYLNLSGGTSAAFWIKETGSDNNGWFPAVTRVFGRRGDIVATLYDYQFALIGPDVLDKDQLPVEGLTGTFNLLSYISFTFYNGILVGFV